MGIRQLFRIFAKDERGVSAVEYAVLLLIPAFALVVSLPLVGTGLNATFADVAGSLGGGGTVLAALSGDEGGSGSSSGDEASASGGDDDGHDGTCNKSGGKSLRGGHSSKGGSWYW